MSIVSLTLRVGAVQLEAGLGEVSENLTRAGRLVEEAARKGATWVVLPEFFPTAMALDERVGAGVQPVDGAPAELLLDLARRLGIVVGGSFIARHPDGAVRNTMVLCGPDGLLGTHDKDIPTMWENCWYERGGDAGIVETPIGPVGLALCWEFVRTQTARRLRERVRLVLGGSCWWDAPENLGPRRLWRAVAAENRRLWDRTLPTFAELLGVPIVHGSWCGAIAGRWALGRRYVTRYVAETAIVAADGAVLARRRPEEGPGVVVGEVEVGPPAPRLDVPPGFWIHPETRRLHWRVFWHLQNWHGRRYRRRRARAPRAAEAVSTSFAVAGGAPLPARGHPALKGHH